MYFFLTAVDDYEDVFYKVTPRPTESKTPPPAKTTINQRFDQKPKAKSPDPVRVVIQPQAAKKAKIKIQSHSKTPETVDSVQLKDIGSLLQKQFTPPPEEQITLLPASDEQEDPLKSKVEAYIAIDQASSIEQANKTSFIEKVSTLNSEMVPTVSEAPQKPISTEPSDEPRNQYKEKASPHSRHRPKATLEDAFASASKPRKKTKEKSSPSGSPRYLNKVHMLQVVIFL